MALWIGNNGSCFTVHTKKPKWELGDCTIENCDGCNGFADPIFDMCYDDAIAVIPALKKLKKKEVTKFTVKIGG